MIGTGLRAWPARPAIYAPAASKKRPQRRTLRPRVELDQKLEALTAFGA